MSDGGLANVGVSIVVSDPWEFGSECGTGPFLGTVTDASADTLVVRLATPITYRGQTLLSAVAKARHIGDQPGSISFKPLSANIILLPLVVSLVVDVSPRLTKNGVIVIGTVEHR